MRNFPNLIDSYLEFVSGHEGTPLVHKWSFISVVAAALERRVHLPRGYYTLFPNLYVFIIGRSGLIKKSTTTGIAVNLFRELKDGVMMSERLTAASLIHQLERAGKRSYMHGGVKQLQSPVFCYASELSVFMTEVFGTTTELLTTFYDCQPNDSTKPWTHNTIKGGDVKIFGPCLNILGASTKAWLSKCIPAKEIEGGFTSRVIFVVEDAIPEKLVAWPEFDASKVAFREKLVADLQQVFRLHGKFLVSPEARQYFDDWYRHHMTEVVPFNQDPKISGYMARKGDTALKLAMIHAAATGNELLITVDGLKWAMRELDSLEPAWRSAFDGRITANSINYAFEIRKFLGRRGKSTKRELQLWMGARMPAGEFAKAIEELVAMEEITVDGDMLSLATSFSLD